MTIETLYEGKFLRLLRDGRWEYVARVNAKGAAFIAAVTDQHELVMVEQYRVPLQAQSLELPAGIVGDEVEFADEGFESAALRELEEETGFRAGHIEHILTGPTAPGMSSELLHFYFASQLVKVSAGGGVEGEDITVHLVPLQGATEWLMAQMAAGKRCDPRVFVGLWFAQQRLQA